MSRRRASSNERRDKMKLRMDTKTPTPRISDPSHPAGRRREIDNVMKKARASPHSNAYWDKRLLEVEAKDPNRWRHSGFKSLYVDESSPSPGHRSRSRSPVGRRSPIGRRSLSPNGRRSPLSPAGRRSRSPVSRRISRSPIGRRPSRSPPFRRSPPRRSPIGRRSPPNNRRSPPGHRGHKPGRPHSPPPSPGRKGRSASASSMSSCTDESCSVCSPRSRRRSRSNSISPPRPKVAPKNGPPPKLRQRPPSPKAAPRRMPRPMNAPPMKKPVRPGTSDIPTDPRRQPPPPRPRNISGEIIDVAGIKPPAPNQKPIKKKDKINQSVMPIKVKKEQGKKRPGSPDSTASEESVCSVSPIVATTRMTLSDRFGKMAQWSIDRGRDIENMRITKNSSGGDLKVMIEDDFLYGGPPERYSHSPVPVGHYPDELSSGPSGLAAWDDVRVRYQYYKDLGYLRDLTLDDYIKWEEWWYKYQEWLANERHYEHWASGQNRRRKHRVPASQRLN